MQLRINCGPAASPYLQMRIAYSSVFVFGAPFRTWATHVVQLWPIAVAHVLEQVANYGGEGCGRLRRFPGKTRECDCIYGSHRWTPRIVAPPDAGDYVKP